MAVYTPPSFNLLCDIWLVPNAPANTATADIEEYPCQKYLLSRKGPVLPCRDWQDWMVHVLIRFPRESGLVFNFAGPWPSWDITYFECPTGSGQYYRVYQYDIQHEGFVNEYCEAICFPTVFAGVTWKNPSRTSLNYGDPEPYLGVPDSP